MDVSGIFEQLRKTPFAALTLLLGVVIVVISFLLPADGFLPARVAPVWPLAAFGGLLAATGIVLTTRALKSADDPAQLEDETTDSDGPALDAGAAPAVPDADEDRNGAEEPTIAEYLEAHPQLRDAFPQEDEVETDRPDPDVLAAYQALTGTQTFVINSLYYETPVTEIGVDDLLRYLDSRTVGRIPSTNELYYRLRDLERAVLIELVSKGEKLTIVKILPHVMNTLALTKKRPS